uniref:Uncharacterized protein n=1 Tax=Arundo donax TaxID=35708 RepID=A0A0A9E790_ARUDO
MIIVQDTEIQSRMHSLSRATRREGPSSSHEHLKYSHNHRSFLLIPTTWHLKSKCDVCTWRICLATIVPSHINRFWFFGTFYTGKV